MNIKLRSFLRVLHDLFSPRIQAKIAQIRSHSRVSRGRASYIHHSVQILGRSFVAIGTNSVLSQDSWLNVNHRSGSGCSIEIGDHCFIGRRNFFSSGKRIEIGHYVLTANDCHFLCSSHIVDDPSYPYLTTGTTDSDIIKIGHNTFIGAGARVLGNVTIGHGSVIGACALVTLDVPPFSQVTGFPATVRRRYSFPRRAWVRVSEFTVDDERAIPDAVNYLAQLRNRPAPRMPYLAVGNDMGQC